MSAPNPQSTGSPINHRYVQLRDVRLHYAETGEDHNELILLLHGFPEFWYSWRHQLEPLGRKYHVVAPDLRGFNLSDKPRGAANYKMNVLSEDVVGLMDHFGAATATVVGHDWGGAVTWAVARYYPERVARIAVMQTPPPGAWQANMSLKQLFRSWYMLLFAMPRVPEWIIRRNNFEAIDRTFRDNVEKKQAFSDNDIELYKNAIRQPGAVTGALNYYRANLRALTSAGKGKSAIRRIAVPTLFIFGEKDFAVDMKTVRGIDRFVSGPYREVRIPDSGHWVQNEAPNEVNAALIDFLEST
jgi:pimeloyl-ACP methyl ester carboxylesterase